MKIALIREGKVPPDARVPLSPEQCLEARKRFGFDIVVQRSSVRCFRDEEYEAMGIPVVDDVSPCEVLMGIKEVPIEALIPHKTYFFFSHTIKMQPYNRRLLQAILKRRITLIDYEVLTDDQGRRLIGFGYYAGVVGAHNTIWAYGRRTGLFQLPRMKDCKDYEEVLGHYRRLHLPPMKIVLTGTGRVGTGAADTLRHMGIRQVEPQDFLAREHFEEAVFTQLSVQHYVGRKDGRPFTKEEFYTQPWAFRSTFLPFAQSADIFINGIFWDKRAPAFFTAEDMRDPRFRIRVIGDITCDIAPESSIPSTLRAATIEEPVFGYDPRTGRETAPFQPHTIDMMTVDNLPSELPREASQSFGRQLLDHVLGELTRPESPVLERATIARDGRLTPRFAYLQEFVEGKVLS